MADKAKVVIKKGTLKLELKRSDLVEVNETHDGVVFNFKDGLSLYYENNFMPQGMKEIIKNTANHFPEKKLIFDLDNESKPAMVDAT